MIYLKKILKKLLVKFQFQNLRRNNQPKKEVTFDKEKLAIAQKEIDEIYKELDTIKREDYDTTKMNPEEFEKDHDENGHIDFIQAAANLRASNYNIDQCDRNQTKMIAGKIIPAILTSTASIAGIVSLQLFTLFQTHELKYLRNCFFNLSNNCFLFSGPSEPIEMTDELFDNTLRGPRKAIPKGWNIWDKMEIKGSKTVGELIDYLKEKYNVEIDILVANGAQLLLTVLPGVEKKRGKKIEDLYYEITKQKKDEKRDYLLIQIIGNVFNVKIEDQDVPKASAYMPVMKYIFK